MNIFSYESKVNQILLTLADLIILNVMYILCCIPVVTISAAQAGLYTGTRVLLDKDDDRSVFKSFFRGFADGFMKSSIAGTILLALFLLVVYIFANTLALYWAGKSIVPVIVSAIAGVLIYCAHSILGPFHASFGCTVVQLIRNSFMVFIAYPLRSLAVGILTALPVVIILIWPQIFVGGVIAFLCMYYSGVYLIIFSLLKAPFDRLKKSYNAAHGIDEDDGDDEEEVEEAEADNLD